MRLHKRFRVAGVRRKHSEKLALEKSAMLKTIALLGLGAAVAFT
jgi:hypothetical protein